MYESEIYIRTIKENLPENILAMFNDTLNSIKYRSILHWTEHCTECSMPECFKTCDLYSPRFDSKCMRFLNGIERISFSKEKSFEILKINFKKWGVLETQGNNEVYNITESNKFERKDLRISSLIHLLWPSFIKKKFAQKRYSIKKNFIIKTQNKSNLTPDAFITEIYNPSDEVIYMSLTIRNEDVKFRKIPFQFRIKINPGYNKESIPFAEIDKRIKLNLQYRISLTPEKIAEDLPLYFGLTEFVTYKKTDSSSEKSNKVKCIVWDLDNTIWDGTLIEMDAYQLKIKDGIKEILNEMDEKGILLSIASKNNFKPAMEVLKRFKIDHFFIFPRISWDPKSLSVKKISQDLNIGINSILFIDDSIFEREEVKSTLPNVRVIDAVEYTKLLEMEELQVPVTEESKNRRKLYLEEGKRKEDSENYSGEYFDFLKSCNIKLELHTLEPKYYERIYELTQRTNQMNFSGNRYLKEDIERIDNDNNLDTFILSCTDKFGDYGIIGLAIINKSENRLIDLMFSCRIQSKRIEHAFITFCLKKYLNNTDFYVTYKHTEKNKFSAQVFQDFGFEIENQENSLQKLIFPVGKPIIDDEIVKIKY